MSIGIMQLALAHWEMTSLIVAIWPCGIGVTGLFGAEWPEAPETGGRVNFLFLALTHALPPRFTSDRRKKLLPYYCLSLCTAITRSTNPRFPAALTGPR